MFQNKLTHNLPLLKNVPNPKRASNMNKKISDSLKLTSRKIVILYGPQGTGKTWTSIDFARQRPNKDQRVIFLNSYTQDKLDFEYRKFAYDYVEISPSTRADKLNLINQVNERLHDLELLFIFDDVRNLSDVDDYLQNLPTYAHVIVTTSLKNDPMSMNLELSGVDRIEQDLFTTKEAFDFVKSQLVNDLGDRSINELIDHLNGPQNKGVSPGELEKCCAILNNSSNKPQENLKAIIKSTKNLTELILDSRFKDSSLIIQLSLLDPDMIPLDVTKLNTLQKDLNALEKFALIKIIRDPAEPNMLYVRMNRKTSDELLAWVKLNSDLAATSKEYGKLVLELDRQFYENFKPESVLYYTSVLHILTLNIKFTLEKNSVKQAQLNLYYKLAFFELNYMQNAESALKFLDLVTDIAAENDLIVTKTFMGKVHYTKGKCYDRMEKYEKAIREKEKSFVIRREFDPQKDVSPLIESLEGLSSSYEKNKNIDKALECDFKALKLKKEMEDSLTLDEEQFELDRSVAKSCFNIGNCYTKKSDYKEALRWFLKSYEGRNELYKHKNHIELFMSLNAIANTYENLNDMENANYYGLMADRMKQDLDRGFMKRRKYAKKDSDGYKRDNAIKDTNFDNDIFRLEPFDPLWIYPPLVDLESVEPRRLKEKSFINEVIANEKIENFHRNRQSSVPIP